MADSTHPFGCAFAMLRGIYRAHAPELLLLEHAARDTEPTDLTSALTDLAETAPPPLRMGDRASEIAWDRWVDQLDRLSGRLMRFARTI